MRRRTILGGAAVAPAALAAGDGEAYWRRIREEQFLLPVTRVFLNNGSLGVAPKPVVRAVQSYLEQSAALLMDEYPRWGYEKMEAHRASLASYVGCDPRDLALTHNATEAMSIVAQGLDLKAGDEVVMTDQEHPSGRGAWAVRELRHGIVVRKVALPLPPRDPGQLAELLIGAIGPKTRVLSFSGITTTTGLVLPVREICRAARAKGVLTLVDGAHMHGQIPFRVDASECDFMAGSPHKWLFAPAGCGLLYIRRELRDRVWPSITTDGWRGVGLEAARFMQVGTNNRAIFEGMAAGLEFARSIGPERIYQRIHDLARTVRQRAAERPELQLLTPDNDAMYGSLVTFRVPPKQFAKFSEICRQRKIWIMGSAQFRVSTHVHTRLEDIDALFAALDEARA